MFLRINECKIILQEEEGKKLLSDAIRAGIFNDLGSGSLVDLCVIRKGSVDYLRPYDVANEKGKRHMAYRYKRGTTATLTKNVRPIIIQEEIVRAVEPESMEVS